jgi:hypothetical protein
MRRMETSCTILIQCWMMTAGQLPPSLCPYMALVHCRAGFNCTDVVHTSLHLFYTHKFKRHIANFIHSICWIMHAFHKQREVFKCRLASQLLVAACGKASQPAVHLHTPQPWSLHSTALSFSQGRQHCPLQSLQHPPKDIERPQRKCLVCA